MRHADSYGLKLYINHAQTTAGKVVDIHPGSHRHSIASVSEAGQRIGYIEHFYNGVSRIVDPQVRGSGPLLRSLSLSLWHKKALSKDCFLQACSRKGSDLETTRDTTTAAAMFYALEFILRDHFYISEPRERGPTHLPPDKGEPR